MFWSKVTICYFEGSWKWPDFDSSIVKQLFEVVPYHEILVRDRLYYCIHYLKVLSRQYQ